MTPIFIFTSYARSCCDSLLYRQLVNDNLCQDWFYFILKWFQFNSFGGNVFLTGDLQKKNANGGGRTRLPKFKFSANFPIGLHVILQLQIKKIQKCLISYVKIYFNRKSVEVQRWTPLEFKMSFVCELPHTVCNGRVSRCCHIEFGSTSLLWKKWKIWERPLYGITEYAFKHLKSHSFSKWEYLTKMSDGDHTFLNHIFQYDVWFRSLRLLILRMSG